MPLSVENFAKIASYLDGGELPISWYFNKHHEIYLSSSNKSANLFTRERQVIHINNENMWVFDKAISFLYQFRDQIKHQKSIQWHSLLFSTVATIVLSNKIDEETMGEYEQIFHMPRNSFIDFFENYERYPVNEEVVSSAIPSPENLELMTTVLDIIGTYKNTAEDEQLGKHVFSFPLSYELDAHGNGPFLAFVSNSAVGSWYKNHRLITHETLGTLVRAYEQLSSLKSYSTDNSKNNYVVSFLPTLYMAKLNKQAVRAFYYLKYIVASDEMDALTKIFQDTGENS